MLAKAFGRALALALLYLSTGCCCLYLRNAENEPFRISITGNQRRIQICGSRLTSMIMSICDGYVNAPKEEHGEKSKYNRTRQIKIDQAGVTEKCCRNQCEFEFLLQHCAEKPNIQTLLQSNAEITEIGDWATYLLRNYTVPTEKVPSEPKTVTPGPGGKDKSNAKKRKNVETFEIGTIKPDILGGDPVVVRSPHSVHRGKFNLLSSSKNLRKSIGTRY